MSVKNPHRILVHYTRLLAKAGLISGSEGNLSVKLEDRILVTPGGVIKSEITPEDLAEVDFSGRVLKGNPTSELPLHLEIYRREPEAGAVVHTHSPYTLALSLAGFDFGKHYLPESQILLSRIVTLPYLPPGSQELAEAAGKAVKEGRILVLARHGTLTVGKTLEEAVNLSLILEKVSRVIYLALNLNPKIKPL